MVVASIAVAADAGSRLCVDMIPQRLIDSDAKNERMINIATSMDPYILLLSSTTTRRSSFLEMMYHASGTTSLATASFRAR